MPSAPNKRRTGSAGLSPAEWRLLRALAEWHAKHPGSKIGPAISALAERLDCGKARCHALVVSVEGRGCIRRRSIRASNDSIRITTKGRRALQAQA